MNDYEVLIHRLSKTIYASDRWLECPGTNDWYDIVDHKYVTADEITEILCRVVELLCRG